jgi:hypothetical protein
MESYGQARGPLSNAHVGRHPAHKIAHSSTAKAVLFYWRDKSQPFCSLTNHPYISGLRTFWALGDFEFNLITLSQGKSFTLDSSTMNEYILSVFHFNKPKALLIAEPLDSTLHHHNLPSKSDL